MGCTACQKEEVLLEEPLLNLEKRLGTICRVPWSAERVAPCRVAAGSVGVGALKKIHVFFSCTATIDSQFQSRLAIEYIPYRSAPMEPRTRTNAWLAC